MNGLTIQACARRYLANDESALGGPGLAVSTGRGRNLLAILKNFVSRGGMKFLRDDYANVELTPRQWAKRALGRIARRHKDELVFEISALPEEDAELVVAEFGRMVKLLEHRRGFILA